MSYSSLLAFQGRNDSQWQCIILHSMASIRSNKIFHLQHSCLEPIEDVTVKMLYPFNSQLQPTSTHNSTWLMVIAFCEMPWPLKSLYSPPHLSSRATKILYRTNMKKSSHQMKYKTHWALCAKWLNYSDDMLQFIGLLGHGGCGCAEPDLEWIIRLLCV